MEWEKYFGESILKRGAEYYKKGKVADFQTDGRKRTATVLGNDEYSVTVEFDEDGNVAAMQCDCPYAESGEYCKHMAAVLYREYYGEVDAAQPKRKPTRKPKRVPISEVEEDTEKSACMSADIEALKGEIKRTINGYKRHGMISYRDAFDCAMEISEMTETNSEALFESGRYKEAFDYSFYVLKKFCSTDMDDSDGGTGMLCNNGIGIWEEAIKDADAEKYVFDKLLKYKGGAGEWYLKDISEDFLFDNFNKRQYNDKKLKYADKRIEETKKDGGFGKYKLGNYLKKKAKVLRNMNVPEEVFEKFCAENWMYYEIQTYYIDEKVESGKFKEAEELLLKCLVRPLRGGITTEYCRRKLMTIYKQIGDREAYRKTLCDYVSFESIRDIEKYKELKSLYTAEEWEKVRDCVQKNAGEHSRELMPEIFSFEGQTDRLLEFAVSYRGMSYIKEYEKELMPYYPTEVLGKYKDEFLRMTASASSRGTYKEIVRDLRRLSKYEDGKTLVRELVAEWREKYPNRRAMMEELDKIVVSKK